MLTIGKPNNQQNKFSLGKETPCRGYPYMTYLDYNNSEQFFT